MSKSRPARGNMVIAGAAGVADYQQLPAQTGLAGTMGLAKDYGLSHSLVHTFHKGLAPRVGFSWRPFATQTAVLRGGYGLFFARQLFKNCPHAVDNTLPFVLQNTSARITAYPVSLTPSA